jgi:hypothetical protein
MGIESILADFEKVETACREIVKRKILVGIVGSVGSDVLTIAHAHEYGDGKLPERSFIRASFDADQNALGKIVSGAINNVLSSKAAPNAAAESIGAQSAQLVQNYIDSNRVKPPSDFSKKTQHTTLYETGTHIRDRIAYKVVNG